MILLAAAQPGHEILRGNGGGAGLIRPECPTGDGEGIAMLPGRDAGHKALFQFQPLAAAEGVGALKSDTKSIIVVSVSCPTADIIGVLHS